MFITDEGSNLIGGIKKILELWKSCFKKTLKTENKIEETTIEEIYKDRQDL